MMNSKLLSLQALSSSKGGKIVVYLAVVSSEEFLNEAVKKKIKIFNVECIVKMGW